METKSSGKIHKDSYLHLQNCDITSGLERELNRLETEGESLQQQLDKLGLTNDELTLIRQLRTLESKLSHVGETVTIRLSKEAEKKIRFQIGEIKEKLDKDLIGKDLIGICRLLDGIHKNTVSIDSTNVQINRHLNELDNNYRRIYDELVEMEYITDDALSKRGVIASRVMSGNNILITELLCDSRFSKLDPASIGCLLSLFIDDGRSSSDENQDEPVELPGVTSDLIDHLYNLSDELSHRYPQFEMTMEEEPIGDSYVYLSYMWSGGAKYIDVMPYMSDFEGNFVRSMLRLAHLCEELTGICQVTGDAELENKLVELRTRLTREIVSFDSLYLKTV